MSEQGVPDIFSAPPLSSQETQRILDEIERYRKEVEAELGPFTTEVLFSGRVLITPQTEVPHVAYMSHQGADARLVFDDYVPEIGDRTLNPDRPSDDQ